MHSVAAGGSLEGDTYWGGRDKSGDKRDGLTLTVKVMIIASTDFLKPDKSNKCFMC